MACAAVDRRSASIARGLVVSVHGLYGGVSPLLPLRGWIGARTSFDVQSFTYQPRQQVCFHALAWCCTELTLCSCCVPLDTCIWACTRTSQLQESVRPMPLQPYVLMLGQDANPHCSRV
jgi:hypothetical protein